MNVFAFFHQRFSISFLDNGGYTDWTGWSQCDKTCGDGKKYRTRQCTNPPPAYGGHDCSWFGDSKEVSNCNDGPCEGEKFLLNSTTQSSSFMVEHRLSTSAHYLFGLHFLTRKQSTARSSHTLLTTVVLSAV